MPGTPEHAEQLLHEGWSCCHPQVSGPGVASAPVCVSATHRLGDGVPACQRTTADLSARTCEYTCARGDSVYLYACTPCMHRQGDEGAECLGMAGEATCLHACVPACGTGREMRAGATVTILWERSSSGQAWWVEVAANSTVLSCLSRDTEPSPAISTRGAQSDHTGDGAPFITTMTLAVMSRWVGQAVPGLQESQDQAWAGVGWGWQGRKALSFLSCLLSSTPIVQPTLRGSHSLQEWGSLGSPGAPRAFSTGCGYSVANALITWGKMSLCRISEENRAGGD